jgi:hypothetical protein
VIPTTARKLLATAGMAPMARLPSLSRTLKPG